MRKLANVQTSLSHSRSSTVYEYMTEMAPFPDKLVDELHALATLVFGSADRSGIAWKLSRMPDVTVQVARARDSLIGFKIGYALAKTRYYSWLGAIHPEHRRCGIAFRLTEIQHEWVEARGFKDVETGIIPENTAMLSLNLRAGFHVIGMYTRGDKPRIMMLKRF